MPQQRRADHLYTCPVRPRPRKKQTCGHALNKASDISLEKVVVGTAPDLTDVCKDAETSLPKSDRAAVHLVIDRPT
ncbi:hypothetical protein AB0P17_29785 [Streptomyces sp. NPDC088124]|uniref:hypothetical protein n=1 Tax=Streptomyces sp. NPDC088124 TaxID=3154654 RepID=UPI003445CF6A